MVDDQPEFVAQIAQHVQGRLERAVHVAARRVLRVLAQVRQQPLPPGRRVREIGFRVRPGQPVPAPALGRRDPELVEDQGLLGVAVRDGEEALGEVRRLRPAGGAQERGVVDRLDLLRHQRPYLREEFGRLGRVGAFAEGGYRLGGEDLGRVAAVGALRVVAAGLVRDAPA